MKIVIENCTGVSPRTPPGRLPPQGAQTAKNVDVRRKTLRPLRSAGSLAVRLPAGTETIYKWGETLSQREWFTWPTEVDVCRGQLAGDDLEWTIFTGDGYPKITNANIFESGLPEDPPESGSSTVDEVHRSYVRQFDGPIATPSYIEILITPLEDAFALASGPVTVSGGGIASNMTDLSGLNTAINGSHTSLSAFVTTAQGASPGSFTLGTALSYQGLVLRLAHGDGGPIGEEFMLSSPFEVAW